MPNKLHSAVFAGCVIWYWW